MFFNRRRKFNGSVAALLPAFKIDMDDAGVFKLLAVLDVAYQQNYNQYEAALLVAYSYASGLCEKVGVESGAKFFADCIKPVESDWTKKGIVRNELADTMYKLYQKYESAARNI